MCGPGYTCPSGIGKGNPDLFVGSANRQLDYNKHVPGNVRKAWSDAALTTGLGAVSGWAFGKLYDKMRGRQKGGNLPRAQKGPPSSQYKRIYGHAKDFGVGNQRGLIDPNTGYLYFPEEGQMNPATGTFFESNQESSVPEDPWNTSRFLYQPFIRGEKQGVHNDWYDSEGNFVKQKELFETDDKMRHRFKRAEEDITKYYKDDLGLPEDEVKKNVKSKMKKLHQMHRATKKMGDHYFKSFQNPDNVFDNALDYEKKYNSYYYDESDDPWQDPDPLGKKAKRAYTKFQKAWRNTPGNEARKNSRQEWKEAEERKKEFIEDFADEYNLTPRQYKKNIDKIKQYQEDKNQYYRNNPPIYDENDGWMEEDLMKGISRIPISSPDPYPDIEWNRSSNKTPLRDRHMKSIRYRSKGGQLSNKISKLYKEGYTADGQAYAIAKNMGYEQGGEYMDLDLTEEQIQNFKNQGFEIDELPKAQGGFGKRKYLKGQKKQNKRYGWKRDKKRSKNEKIDEVEEIIEETPTQTNYTLDEPFVLDNPYDNQYYNQAVDDRIEFLTSPEYYQNALTFWGSEEAANENIQKQINRIKSSKSPITYSTDDPGGGGASGYYNPNTQQLAVRDDIKDTEKGRYVYSHEIDHLTAGESIDEQGVTHLYPEFKPYEDLELRSDYVDGNHAILHDRGAYTDEEYEQVKKENKEYQEDPAEFRERLNSIKMHMQKNDFNWNDKTGEEILKYIYDEIGHTDDKYGLPQQAIDEYYKKGYPMSLSDHNTLNQVKDVLLEYNQTPKVGGNYASNDIKSAENYYNLSDRQKRKVLKTTERADKLNDLNIRYKDFNKRQKRIWDRRGKIRNKYALNKTPWDLDDWRKSENVDDFINDNYSYFNEEIDSPGDIQWMGEENIVEGSYYQSLLNKYENEGWLDETKHTKEEIEKRKEHLEWEKQYEIEWNKERKEQLYKDRDGDGKPDYNYDLDWDVPDPKFIEKIFKEYAEEPTIPDAGQLPRAQGGMEKKIQEDKSRVYEDGIRYVDPNNTGPLNLKFTTNGGAYEEIDGKYYKYKFTTDKDKINYDPTEGIDWNPDLTLDASGSMSVEEKEKYDNRYADQMYKGLEERKQSLAEDGFDSEGNYAAWRDKGYSSADDYYDMMGDQGKYSYASMAKDMAELTAKKIKNDPMGALHIGLDGLGMTPGLGIIPDMINAGIYGLEGDWENMGWSSSAAIPFAGLFTTPSKYVKKAYNKIATGNSIIPRAWKSGVDGVSNFKQFDKLKGVSLTKQEAELLQKWQYSSYANRMTTAERTQLDNLIKKYNLGDQIIEAPITRIQGYQGDPTKFSTKYGTEFGGGKEWTSPRAFSVGPYQKGRPFNAEGSQRIIIPERYAKNMGKDFFKVPIKDSKNLREVIRNSDQNSIFLYQEKELLGMPKLKVIGRDNSGHFNDIIVKPIKSTGGEYLDLDLTEDQIKNFRDGGFVVEDLPKAQTGNLEFKQPINFVAKDPIEDETSDEILERQWHYLNMSKDSKQPVDIDTYPDQILTYKDHPEWFNSHADWTYNIKDPDGKYNDIVKKRVHSGNWGFNPSTGTLYKLETLRQKFDTKEDHRQAYGEREDEKPEYLLDARDPYWQNKYKEMGFVEGVNRFSTPENVNKIFGNIKENRIKNDPIKNALYNNPYNLNRADLLDYGKEAQKVFLYADKNNLDAPEILKNAYPNLNLTNDEIYRYLYVITSLNAGTSQEDIQRHLDNRTGPGFGKNNAYPSYLLDMNDQVDAYKELEEMGDNWSFRDIYNLVNENTYGDPDAYAANKAGDTRYYTNPDGSRNEKRWQKWLMANHLLTMYHNPVWNTAVAFHPASWPVYGTLGATMLPGDVQELASNPSWGNASNVGMDFLMTSPFTIPSIIKGVNSARSNMNKFGSYLQNNATNTYNKAIEYFNDYYMTAIPEAGVQSAYIKNILKSNKNKNITMAEQLRNDGTLIEPIIYDNSLISNPLPIDKVPYISKRITPLSQEEKIYNSFSYSGMYKPKITNFNRAGDVIDESGNIINQTYIKSFKDRTHPVRGGKTFSDGVAEYNSLKSMHDLYPDKFVKPIKITVNKKGEATGYMMEKVNGVTLDKWLKDNKMSQLMYEDIKSTIEGLHRKGIYHGDLKANNIMVDEWGNWKIIDPVGFKHSNQMTDKMLKEAKKLDSESINSIRKLYENQN
jgi:hypothetical protein